MAQADKLILFCTTADEWEHWIETHGTTTGVRLRLRKKPSTKAGITYAEALDVALCHGWIDGQAQSEDVDYYLVGFTPRRARSIWSKRNREHVARLIADGRMRPRGLAEVDRAKADGRWDAAYRQSDAVVPADLAAALAASPGAATAFAALSSQNRFAIIFRLGNVKREATRARKLEGFIAMLEAGETLH